MWQRHFLDVIYLADNCFSCVSIGIASVSHDLVKIRTFSNVEIRGGAEVYLLIILHVVHEVIGAERHAAHLARSRPKVF